MQHLKFSRIFLLACVLVPACGDNGGDSSTGTTTNDPTPANPTDPTGTSTVDPTGTDTTEPTTTTTTPTTTSTPTGDSTVDPMTDPTADPTTDPTGADGTFCQEQCAVDGDCTLMGMDLGYKCTEGRCATGCADDDACVQQFSLWITDCTAQMDCLGQVCIDTGNGGKCANAPNEFVMCEALMLSEIMMPPIEGGAPIAVCANTDYTCSADGVCVNPCESDAECVVPGLTQCDLATGTCQCADDAGCTAANPATPRCTEAGSCGCGSDEDCVIPNAPTCNANGQCGCATDDNCIAAMTGDRCFEGNCGCSDSTACPATTTFTGTMFVCESL